MGEATRELTRASLGDLVWEAEVPTFVDVWGPQCVPCVALSPVYEELAEQFADDAAFLKLEAPANRMACVDLKVMSLPTFVLYVGGEERSRLDGEVKGDDLREWVAGQLEKSTTEKGSSK